VMDLQQYPMHEKRGLFKSKMSTSHFAVPLRSTSGQEQT
jgi:hypothetical protein